MDHSGDEDSKLPPSTAQQQQHLQQRTGLPPHHPQQQQQQLPFWEASQAYVGGGGVGGGASTLPLQRHPQQQQQQQYFPPGISPAAGLAPTGYPTRQSVAGLGVYPVVDVSSAASSVTAAASDPYQRQQRHHQQQQQLLYQQQVAAYAAAQSAGVGLGGSGGIPPQPPPQYQTHLPPAAYYGAPPDRHHHPQLPPSAGYFPSSSQPVLPPPIAQAPQLLPQPTFQPPRVGRIPSERPLIKLSVALIDTYKNINTVYYEDRDARRAARAKEKKTASQQQQQQELGPGVGGPNNNGWDDENYDYIVTQGEIFYGRYKIKERIGKGSFGQVVRAEDIQSHREVAIKIIKSKKPFLMQAKTEIELLTHLWERDPEDQHNIVRLLTHFMYRNHQCLVFEMLSLNLYELLKNTQFGGVSLNLIRKFGKQVLKALAFLAKSDVDIIHCDLKPENILLRHPKKSGVKVIDFGSSCRSNKRMYSYIQSRFYRSPEVMLGLPYSVAIDMWSLGCILAEMHTGEPLFSGSDQFDQMQKIVKLLGMIPTSMLERSSDSVKLQFFEYTKSTATGLYEWRLRQTKPPSTKTDAPSLSMETTSTEPIIPSTDPIASLKSVITAGNRQKKKFPPSEAYNSARNYELFVDLIYKMLTYQPEDRIKPEEAMNHPFIIAGEQGLAASTTPSSVR